MAKILTSETLNPSLLSMKNDFENPVLKKCHEIERELKKGIEKPFRKILRADIDDMHAVGQKSISFIQQVLALCTYPLLLNDPSFPDDAKKRANEILDCCGGRSAGAYTYSQGMELIRQHVAQYFERRDNHPASASDVFLTFGTGDALKSILNVLNMPQNSIPVGVMVPVPRNPCVSKILREINMVEINYYLEESSNWSVSLNDLYTSLMNASGYCQPRAILVVNPGYPTGSVLSLSNMEDIIHFASEKKLVLIADESYQLYALAQILHFQSFKKVMMTMGDPFNKMELVSIMSSSTGALGGFGLNSGCCELVNIRREVMEVYQKSISVKMCPGVPGQVVLDCIIYPPAPHEPSYECFIQEWQEMMQLHQEKASMMINALNVMDKIQCNPYTAATTLFPKLYIPEKAILDAKSKGYSPDTLYAMQLLENTGICSTPGTLYGQLPGTYHLQITVLKEKKEIEEIIELFRNFNNYFIKKYS